jgi:hypothetical protein
MKMKKVKKIIGWIILAAITVGILSVPIIEMGWRDGLGIFGLILVLFGMTYWAMDAITGE